MTDGPDREPSDLVMEDTGEASTESARTDRAESGSSTAGGEGEKALGWRGWVLVGAVLVSFFAIPWTIILLPRAQGVLGSLGLGWRDAYLVLPLVPALGLGALAVWAAVANRGG